MSPHLTDSASDRPRRLRTPLCDAPGDGVNGNGLLSSGEQGANGPVYSDAELFDCGTLLKLRLRALSGQERARSIVARTGLTVLVGWIPLVFLATYQGLVFRDASLTSFLSDFAVSGRSLVAASLLVLAEWVCVPRLGALAFQFRESGIVAPSDAVRFDTAWRSTSRLRESILADIALLVIAYAVVTALVSIVPLSRYPAWHVSASSGRVVYSAAGWWHVLVSLPLLFWLLLTWFWRLCLWTRFLLLMSRLDLRLVPAHPDRTAGLRFVAYSVQSFALIALALGVITASSTANRILHQGAPLESVAPTVFGLVTFVLIIFAGPLLLFMPHLLKAWRRGTQYYGALAAKVGRQFERKWFDSGVLINEGALGVQDFSATTDLYQVASNVYEVRIVPVSVVSLAILTVMAILPFLAVALMFTPLDVIMREIAALLL